MDTHVLADLKAKKEGVSLSQELDDLKAELVDTRHELDGARDTIERLSAEIRRLQQRYHVAAEGDL